MSSNRFDCAYMRKGNLIYLCINTHKDMLKCGQEFIDDKYQNNQISQLYSNQEHKNSLTIAQTQHQHPSAFSMSVKRQSRESNSYIRKQIEYLHIQFISLITGNVNQQLAKKPNLDIKTSIAGLERTMDMMCEVS